ncbi:MAG: pilus assembly protein [Pseudolabrys sp.]|jgi:Flp pilus assembly protein TadG
MSTPAKAFIAMVRKLAVKVNAIRADRRGVAAIEFALFVGFISVAVLNTADVSIYIYKRMQVENATEMGAQAAWQHCGLDQLPATTNCSGFLTAVQNAIQSTSLGTQVSLQTGYPTEGWYCVDSSGVLQYVSDYSTKPADCSAVGTTYQPADYVKIQTTYTYTPLFGGISVAGAFTTPIVRTAMMRLN